MTLAEAKARLVELGQKRSVPAKILADPLARTGLLLLGGVVAGRLLLRRPGNDGAGASIRRAAVRAGLAAAPALVEQFVHGIARRSTAHERAHGTPDGQPRA
jgi:hypothetical protein